MSETWVQVLCTPFPWLSGLLPGRTRPARLNLHGPLNQYRFEIQAGTHTETFILRMSLGLRSIMPVRRES